MTKNSAAIVFLGLVLIAGSAMAQSREKIENEIWNRFRTYAETMGALELYGRACGLKSVGDLKAEVAATGSEFYGSAGASRSLILYNREQERMGRISVCDQDQVKRLMLQAKAEDAEMRKLRRKLN